MEKNIILIHSGLAVLLLLYLLIRLLISLFGLSDKEYQAKVRSKFRRSDWFFAGILAISGLYPIILLGQIELYHIVKLIILGLFIWSSRYAEKTNFAGMTLIAIFLMGVAGYTSFTDQPKFPRKAGTFEKQYPEVANMSVIEEGRLIFNTICMKCHGADGTKGRFGAADLTLSETSQEEKIDIITNGSPLTVMRSFSNELSEGEIEAVASYVQSLKK